MDPKLVRSQFLDGWVEPRRSGAAEPAGARAEAIAKKGAKPSRMVFGCEA
jgi:hypothetical protein